MNTQFYDFWREKECKEGIYSEDHCFSIGQTAKRHLLLKAC